MKRKVPAVQDIVRIIRPSHDETVLALKKYLEGGGGSFNYQASADLARKTFQQEFSLPEVAAACQALRHPVARVQNAEVLGYVWRHGTNRSVRTYEVAPKVIGIRSDVSVRVAPTFAFVEDGVPSLFWLQPRKRFALSIRQLGLLGSLIRKTYLVDDFANVGLEFLDLSVGSGNQRQCAAHRLEELPTLSDDEVAHCLDRFLCAYDAIPESDAKKQDRPPRPSPPSAGLFDE
jgi:hypothetical protein